MSDWLLRLIADVGDRKLIAADLREEYQVAVRPELGPFRARAWLLSMTVRSVVAWWGDRLRLWSMGLGVDVAASVRSLLRSPRLMAVAAASIALGVTVTGAVLTLYSSAVLRPLPFPDAARLVRVWNAELGGNIRAGLSWGDVRDVRDGMGSFDAFAATARARLTVMGPDGARRAQGEGVTAGYFALLGVRPALGRLLDGADHLPTAAPAMVLTWDAWQERYGGGSHVLGATVRTTAGAFTVVGVAERGFRGTIENDLLDQEFWVPIEQVLGPADRDRRGAGNIWTIGRLADGATPSRAAGELSSIDEALRRDFAEARGARTLRLEPMGESWRSQLRPRNRLLVAAALLLLLVASLNVAGLLVTRTISRRRELAVRAALGSGRGRLVRLVALEASLLTGAGGLVGLVAAPFVLGGFLVLAPEGLPAYVTVHPDIASLFLSFLAVGVTAVVAAVATAALGTRVDLDATLRSEGHGATLSRGERRKGEWIIVGEVALTTVLLVTAGLLGRSLQAMSHADLGYRTDHLLRMAMTLDARDAGGSEATPEFLDRLRGTAATYPGVVRVGLTWQALPPGYETNRPFRFDGMPEAFAGEGVPAGFHAVDPDLLPALGVEFLAGRNFSTEDDGSARRVAIVSRSIADMMGGPEGAVGRSIAYDGRPREVVGVTHDVMYQGPVRRRSHDFDVYVPLAQETGRTISLAIETRDDPSAYAGALQRRLGKLAPSSPQHWISTMSAEIADDLGGPFFYAALVSAFALSALSLMAVGLFAMLAYQVARQRSEFGVRRVVGATRGRLVTMVAWRGLRPSAAGVLLGGLGSLPAGRALGVLLYGVPAVDGVTLAGSVVGVLCVTALGAALCAGSVWRIGPHEALGGV